MVLTGTILMGMVVAMRLEETMDMVIEDTDTTGKKQFKKTLGLTPECFLF